MTVQNVPPSAENVGTLQTRRAAGTSRTYVLHNRFTCIPRFPVVYGLGVQEQTK